MEGMLFLLVVTLPATFGQLTLMPSSSDDCRTECHDDKSRVVCGTDNRTYRSICELRKAKCEGHHVVDLKHLGKCTEPVRCRAERAQAQAQALSVDGMVYIPECLDDGSYAEVQCQPSIGYCWCVEPSGRPIPGSSLQFQKPVCSQQGCRNAERTKFNENLIEIFKTEYHRLSPSLSSTHTDTRVDSSGNSEVKRVVQWKFDELDVNKDNSLKRKEVRDLSRMTKRIVAPRTCAKTFTDHCDLDHDNRISRNEWYLCLGLDINKKGVTSIRDLHGMRLKHYDADEESEHVKNSDDGGDSYNRAENHDCASARASALDNHRQDPGGGHYIPECTPDGSYEKSQCHKKINVCWCVNPRTGKPIRGTGARGSLPDCENVLRSAKMFKGCSLQRKHLFLEELLIHLSKQANIPKNSSDRGSYAISKDEIFRWKFNALDANNNEFLDKKEWLAFRNEWKSFLKSKKQRKKARKLRKCWRNFPRLCDGNSNNKITIEEWISCTNSGRNYMQNFAPQKRRGPNPFSTILKSE